MSRHLDGGSELCGTTEPVSRVAVMQTLMVSGSDSIGAVRHEAYEWLI